MDQEKNSEILEKGKTYTPEKSKQITTGGLESYMDKELLISLQASQLSILNQTFRPLMVGKLTRLDNKYAYFTHVNIKMQNAPEFEFPTPLFIPIKEIAWYLEFNRTTRFSIY